MVALVGPSYTLAIRKADIQRTVNMHLLSLETPGKAPFVLDSVEGLVDLATFSGAARGAIAFANRAFFVFGSGLYEVFKDSTSIKRGTLRTVAGAVSMDYGLRQLVLVDGPNGYVLKLDTNAFLNISATGFYGSSRVRFLDNYFLFLRPDTQQFYISAINDATSDDPTDFASAESSPDQLVSIEVLNNEVVLFGEVTTEIWFNSGNVDFPFQRNTGQSYSIGCMAAQSVIKADNTVYWLGRDANGSGIVYGNGGSGPQRISTQAVEQAFSLSTDLSKTVAYAYQRDGLTFIAFNAPGLKSTWVHEVSTRAWHERCDLDKYGEFKAGRVTCHAFAFGKHLVGGDDAKLYQLSKTCYRNGDQALVRERTSPHSVTPLRKRQFFSEFWLDCTTGEAAQSDDNVVELSWSGDSGANWTDPITRSAGRVGERFPRLHWNKLGFDIDRVWKLRFDCDAPFAVIDGGAETTEAVQ